MKKLKHKIIRHLFILIFLFSGISYLIGQANDTLPSQQTNETQTIDSVKLATNAYQDEISDPIKYSAKDSIVFDMEKKIVHLYGDAHVEYQKIDLKAAYIEFNMNEQTVFATGTTDSTGQEIGKPIFKDGNDQFESKWIRYNFKTRKGFVYFVKTEQGGGYLIGDSTKRNANGEIYLKGASFSTCNLDHPHFYLKLTKAIAVPEDKIVTGPAYLVVADIPFKMIFVPFGYVPNTKKSYASGILMPSYGEDNARGLALREGGYYFAISDYVDARITGEIYSKGSWGLAAQSNYKVRYRFSGNFSFRFNQSVYSEKGLPDYAVKNDYKFSWQHTQDQKANPNTRFSADVNVSSSSYDKRNSYNINDYITNTRSSGITFSRTWPNSPFNLSGSLKHTQNNETRQIFMSLPQLSFNMNTIYPFRKEDAVGPSKWYENIQLSYRANLDNDVYTTDSLFLTRHIMDSTNTGFSHEIPVSLNIKITRSINLTPSLNYKGVAYPKYYTYQWDSLYYNSNTGKYGKVDTIVHNQWVYGHSLYPSISTGYSPKVYGMFVFRNSRIKAIRHIMSPSASFSFIPDISEFMPNYYYKYYNGVGMKTVSRFERTKYGTPSPPPGKSANISFSLRNNFEMKYLPKQDTAQKEKKISLLDNLDFSGSYNLMADSFNLSNISMASGTNLFDNKLSLRFDAVFDPYQIDSLGRRKNVFELKDGRLARMTSASFSLSTSLSSSERKTQTPSSNPSDTIGKPRTSSTNFSVPWNLSLNYNFSYVRGTTRLNRSQYIQSVGIRGDLSLTKKWKISFSTGYDITNGEMTITQINIHRDLHCWEMSLSIVPFGPRQSYFFTINALGLLKDLKYTKNNDAWRSRF
ncbi:MAG: putative LPS assembly protein LptD [Bacteroidales bacterium]|nr:putative LPS assembly protein LptD [Bacteroidales bacterium]